MLNSIKNRAGHLALRLGLAWTQRNQSNGAGNVNDNCNASDSDGNISTSANVAATATATATATTPIDGPYYPKQDLSYILHVLIVLGQWLIFLEVINHEALPEASRAVRRALLAVSDHDEIGDYFDNLDVKKQQAVVCALVFCAECWPMHMWRGFGCGVYNDMGWAYPGSCSECCDLTDCVISAVKSAPHEWQLLRKSPSRISHTQPWTRETGWMTVMKLDWLLSGILTTFAKQGLPLSEALSDDDAQQQQQQRKVKLTQWHIPFATWGGNSMYAALSASYAKPLYRYQCDPGRLLWAWTAGKRSELKPNEAIALLVRHVADLATWLEGLHGMNFKVLKLKDLDDSKVKLNLWTRWQMYRLRGSSDNDDDDDDDTPIVMVLDPKRPSSAAMTGGSSAAAALLSVPLPAYTPRESSTLAQEMEIVANASSSSSRAQQDHSIPSASVAVATTTSSSSSDPSSVTTTTSASDPDAAQDVGSTTNTTPDTSDNSSQKSWETVTDA